MCKEFGNDIKCTTMKLYKMHKEYKITFPKYIPKSVNNC